MTFLPNYLLNCTQSAKLTTHIPNKYSTGISKTYLYGPINYHTVSYREGT